ncbi:MAG: phenylalanine--tRNA ligase subunit beta [Magnetococcales bacterium]|nr:phenylalanine--tRNA ligase subunit beta [Magnetococcales bacterium]NGZ27129.1 phenylalanine--tRNA ligase subunit beta [Magnetococcales bacterium]
MKFTYGWLSEHLNCTLDANLLGEKLTMAGLELDGLTDLSSSLAKVEVGIIQSIDRHPAADRLTVCQVAVGEGPLTIVCGATNHRVGNKVAVARVGARLAGGLVIAESTIRGVPSFGMLCSVKELGLADSADGVLILPEDAPVGAELAQVLGRKDWLFDVATTPNRGDCLSVRGIAREMGAVLSLPLLALPNHQVAVDSAISAPPVVVEDGVGCPRYSGRLVKGVRIGPSPDWLRQRLEAVGMRSINNVVDATNYVMLEMGQPLHAFDLAALKLPLVVRRAQQGEQMTTLDGMVRTLSGEMTLIADQARPLALAGIMGGEESGVVETTTDLLLESAYFEPIRVARTGRRLGLISESRYRFERGVDPMGITTALDRLTAIILEISGGQAGEITLVDSGLWKAGEAIPFRLSRANRLMGIHVSEEDAQRYLTALGCVRQGVEGDKIFYAPPSWRSDLRREEDLMEEVVRLFGYDRVPSRLPEGALQPVVLPINDTLQTKVRRLLVGAGYLENINYSFVSRELLHHFTPDLNPLGLLNPLSEEQGVLRTALLPGLVDSARRNISRGNQKLRLFEIGRVFLPDGDGAVQEEERVAGLISHVGDRLWHTPRRAADFFDLKGDLENLLAGLQVEIKEFQSGGPAYLHPGRSARIFMKESGLEVGSLGQLHPSLQESLELTQPVLVFELTMAHLVQRSGSKKAASLSRYQAVERDFAFVVEESVSAATLLAATQEVDPQLIREVSLFDLYAGPHLAAGMKSMAVSILLQADDHTLTEQEIQELSQKIIQRMNQRFGAGLRGPNC